MSKRTKSAIITTLVITSTLFSFISQAQSLDSAQLDLKTMKGIDFFKKYSFYDRTISAIDIEITQLVWSLNHLRSIDGELREKGIKTFTQIESRPSKDNPYYIIGHYQLPTKENLTRMAYYRFDVKTREIEYQSLIGFANESWQKLR